MTLRDSLLSPLGKPARLALCILAFVGTALYSSSYALRPDAAKLVPLASGIGISAGLAWMVLGQAILASYRRGYNGVRGSMMLMMWFDTCLLAIGVGEVLLVCAAASNFVGFATKHAWTMPLGAHAAILTLADLAMGAMFIGRSAAFGIPRRHSAILWIGALNGSFAAILWMLSKPLGY